MLQEKNQITIRQTIILFIVSTLSPAIRIFPNICSEMGQEAAWLGPVISSTGMFLIFTVLGQFFKNKNITDLGGVFDVSMGKFFGVTVRIIYLFWIMLLYFLYIRYYAERLVTSIFKNTDMRFFIFIMMIVVFIAARGKIEAFARFCELSILFFIVVMSVFFIFLLPSIKVENLYPITHYNLIPAVRSAYPILGIWAYLTFAMFLGHNIKDKEQIIKYRKNFILFLTAMTTLIVFFIVGSLGYKTAERMPLPFFSATKMIVFMESLDRLESILLSIWVVSDFIIITAFALIIMHVIKGIFKLSTVKYLSFPVSLLGFFGSLWLTQNRFELEIFTKKIGLSVNIILGFIVPVIVFGIGKLRKKI